MEHQADVHPQLRLILPDAGPGCEKNGRRATWPVTTRSGRHQVPVAVLPTAKSLSAFSLKPQSDRLLGDFITAAGNPEKLKEAFRRSIPLGRIGAPADLPGAICFFASEDAAFITGQVLSVSGGLTMAG